MAGIMAGLMGVLIVAAGIVAYGIKSSKSGRHPLVSGKSPEAMAEELRRLREMESDVERTCRETQEAIITRAMWRIVRPMGGGKQ